MTRDPKLDRLFKNARQELYASPSVVAQVRTRISRNEECESDLLSNRSPSVRVRWHLYAMRMLTMAAAAVLLGMFASTVWNTNPGNIVFAQVLERVAETKSMQAEITTNKFKGRLVVADSRRRLEGKGFAIVCDSQAKQEIFIDTQNKTVHRNVGQFMKLIPDWYALFRSLDTVKEEQIEDFTDESGVRRPGFRGVTMFTVGDQSEAIHVDVWVHPRTHLPVRAELEFSESPQDTVLFDNIQFDVPVLDEMFVSEIPEGYQIVGLAEKDLQPPLNEAQAAELTIIPGVGVGRIRFGMSSQEISEILGEPEFVQHDSYLCYPSKGLQFIVGGNELQTIIANPGDAPSLVQHDFPGRTDKGMGIGSTMEQLMEAYPNLKPRHYNGIPVIDMHDEASGITFGTVDGVVGQIRMIRAK